MRVYRRRRAAAAPCSIGRRLRTHRRTCGAAGGPALLAGESVMTASAPAATELHASARVWSLHARTAKWRARTRHAARVPPAAPGPQQPPSGPSPPAARGGRASPRRRIVRCIVDCLVAPLCVPAPAHRKALRDACAGGARLAHASSCRAVRGALGAIAPRSASVAIRLRRLMLASPAVRPPALRTAHRRPPRSVAAMALSPRRVAAASPPPLFGLADDDAVPELIVFDCDACLWSPEMFQLCALGKRDWRRRAAFRARRRPPRLGGASAAAVMSRHTRGACGCARRAAAHALAATRG